ncbi:hypothetical protein D3C75_439890 [compost metagenome]
MGVAVALQYLANTAARHSAKRNVGASRCGKVRDRLSQQAGRRKECTGSQGAALDRTSKCCGLGVNPLPAQFAETLLTHGQANAAGGNRQAAGSSAERESGTDIAQAKQDLRGCAVGLGVRA